MRDRNRETESEIDYEDQSKTLRPASLIERLDLRKHRAQETIKYAQAELAEVEEGLKLLNKNNIMSINLKKNAIH